MAPTQFICGDCGKSFTRLNGGYSRAKWPKYCSRSCSGHAHPTRNVKRASQVASATEQPSLKDIYWAAGIYEGEGTCSRRRNTPGVAISQKDPHILHRLSALFGGTVGGRVRNSGTEFYIHRWYIYGRRAIGFLLTIFSILSPRRRAQARIALGVS